MNTNETNVFTAEYVIDALPHGSGINGTWYAREISHGLFECSNQYSPMDCNGSYNADVGFTALVQWHIPMSRPYLVEVTLDEDDCPVMNWDEDGEEYDDTDMLLEYLGDDIREYLSI